MQRYIGVMEIKSLDVSDLKPDEIKQYALLTTEEFLPLLHSKHPRNIKDLKIMAYVAIQDNKPVGLLLSTSTENFYISEIHSLFVDEKYRNQKIATTLINTFEKTLRDLKCFMITMFYSNAIESKLQFEHLIKKCEFTPPFPLIYRYFYKGAHFNPDWIGKKYRYPAHFSTIYFKELQEEERKSLLTREDQGAIPCEVSPFLNEEAIEPSNSFFLKDKDRIIGWIITHRVNETLIRYSSLYIEPEYQHLGYSIKLLIDSMQIQKQNISKNHPAIFAVFDLNTNQTDKNWQHFIEKRLSPHADKVEILYLTWKQLN